MNLKNMKSAERLPREEQEEMLMSTIASVQMGMTAVEKGAAIEKWNMKTSCETKFILHCISGVQRVATVTQSSLKLDLYDKNNLQIN